MLWRKILAVILVVMMTSPAWSAAEPVGSVTSSNGSTIRDTKLAPGSTVFNGDTISVGERGAARISLNGGAQAEILSNSLVRLTKSGGDLEMEVDRGQASFHTSGGNHVSARVTDASVRPVGGGETAAVIQSLNKMHAVIAAEKGSLVVTTAYDNKSYTILEGQAADLSLAPAEQQDGTAAPAGQAAPPVSDPKLSKKQVVAWTVVLVGGAVALTAYLLARKETKPTPVQLQNEISPHKLD